MAKSEEFYTFNHDLWQSAAGSRPAMFSFLDGFMDAGKVGSTIAEYLLEHSSNQVLATFDIDLTHDFRARRPRMTFDTDSWKSVDEVTLTLHLARDGDGVPFLVLVGPEPDMRWNGLRDALIDLVEKLDVSLVLSAHGVPMTVPHTRPTPITRHATDETLRRENPRWVDRIEIPASFASYLELALGKHGRHAMGLAVHVPHYLAQGNYGRAAELALQQLLDVTRLNLPMEPLRETAEANLALINAETLEAPDARDLIAALETQYDEFTAATDAALPSADELGAAFERFLADQDDQGAR